MKNDGLGNTYLEELTDCDGSKPTVITNMYCDVPMTVLRAEPFSYRKGMLIRAIARAYNLFEWGQWSQPNVEGALLETEPVGVTTLTFLDTPVSNNNQVLL